MSLIQEAAAGSNAQAHFEFLEPIFKQLKDELLKDWATTLPMHSARREEIWREIRAADRALEKILQIIETGHLARASLDKQRKNG